MGSGPGHALARRLVATLAQGKNGFGATVGLNAASDRGLEGTIAFEYQGEPCCEYGLEISPL